MDDNDSLERLALAGRIYIPPKEKDFSTSGLIARSRSFF